MSVDVPIFLLPVNLIKNYRTDAYIIIIIINFITYSLYTYASIYGSCPKHSTIKTLQ